MVAAGRAGPADAAAGVWRAGRALPAPRARAPAAVRGGGGRAARHARRARGRGLPGLRTAAAGSATRPRLATGRRRHPALRPACLGPSVQGALESCGSGRKGLHGEAYLGMGALRDPKNVSHCSPGVDGARDALQLQGGRCLKVYSTAWAHAGKQLHHRSKLWRARVGGRPGAFGAPCGGK
jgi:hypothetical protein